MLVRGQVSPAPMFYLDGLRLSSPLLQNKVEPRDPPQESALPRSVTCYLSPLICISVNDLIRRCASEDGVCYCRPRSTCCSTWREGSPSVAWILCRRGRSTEEGRSTSSRTSNSHRDLGNPQGDCGTQSQPFQRQCESPGRSSSTFCETFRGN